MAADGSVKMEDDMHVKSEPDTDQAIRMLDDEDPEDTGELEFPEHPPMAWLARVPNILWDEWNLINGDQEIQLGVVRRYKKSNRYKMVLNPKAKPNQRAPKAYNMNLHPSTINNHFIFSEKDMPGFHKNSREVFEKDSMGPSPGAGVHKPHKQGRQYRRAIPSQLRGRLRWEYLPDSNPQTPEQTVLNAIIKREIDCTVMENDEHLRLLRDRDRGANKAQMRFLAGDPRQYTRMAQTGVAAENFEGFVKPTHATKHKPQENKAVRMDQTELMDRLFESFGEYEYWSLKAFKERLRQPESYLKEVLPMIADLVRSGPFSGQYRLRDENRARASELQVKEEAAPENDDDQDDNNNTGDDDAQMDDLPE